MAQRRPSRSPDIEAFREALIGGASALGLEVGEGVLEDLCLYYVELVRWNARKNLTSIEGPREAAVKHFLDSLTLYPLLSPSEALLDLGSGAGFPGLCLKVYDRGLRVTLLEASFKRVAFLRHMVRRLSLGDTVVIHGRAEDPGLLEAWRGRFDVVTGRAIGPLGEFLPLAEPYLRPGGRVIAMKGPRWQEEVKGVEGRLRFQGAKELELPFGMGRRALLVFLKP